jgi:hypothetical protein
VAVGCSEHCFAGSEFCFKLLGLFVTLNVGWKNQTWFLMLYSLDMRDCLLMSHTLLETCNVDDGRRLNLDPCRHLQSRTDALRVELLTGCEG